MARMDAFRKAIERTVPHMEAGGGELGLILESDGKHLFVAATDRYTIAVSRMLVMNTTPWKTMIGHAAVKKLQACLGAMGDDVQFTHDARSRRLRIASGDTVVGLPTLQPRHLNLADDDGFFDWRLVIRRQYQLAPADVSTEMTVKFLARWQHLGERATFWTTGERKPVMVVAEDFIGGQMPITHDGRERARLEHVASWVPIVGKHAEYAGVDYDLSRTYFDQDGDPWEYVRHESVTGEPLMNVPGLDGGEMTLAALVETYGPLRAGAKI